MFKLESLIRNIEDEISIIVKSGHKSILFIELLVLSLPEECKYQMIGIVVKNLEVFLDNSAGRYLLIKIIESNFNYDVNLLIEELENHMSKLLFKDYCIKLCITILK